MTFQECLNSYIKELGCSGKELAANSGISETVISRYRKGERLPASDSEYLKKLADGIVKTAIEKGRPDWERRKCSSKAERNACRGTACANETLVDAWKRQMQESSGAFSLYGKQP